MDAFEVLIVALICLVSGGLIGFEIGGLWAGSRHSKITDQQTNAYQTLSVYAPKEALPRILGMGKTRALAPALKPGFQSGMHAATQGPYRRIADVSPSQAPGAAFQVHVFKGRETA